MHSVPRFSVRDITMVGLFTAIMAVLSQITIPLEPVPFSFGIMGVMLTAAILPTRLAVTTQLVYLAIGAFGVPVFSQFQGGLQRLAGPTGGYLVGYVLMALVVGILLTLRSKSGYFYTAFACICGFCVCHLCGTLWLALSTGIGLKAAALSGTVPFIAFDLLKAFLTALVAVRVQAVYKQYSA